MVGFGDHPRFAKEGKPLTIDLDPKFTYEFGYNERIRERDSYTVQSPYHTTSKLRFAFSDKHGWCLQNADTNLALALSDLPPEESIIIDDQTDPASSAFSNPLKKLMGYDSVDVKFEIISSGGRTKVKLQPAFFEPRDKNRENYAWVKPAKTSPNQPVDIKRVLIRRDKKKISSLYDYELTASERTIRARDNQSFGLNLMREAQSLWDGIEVMMHCCV